MERKSIILNFIYILLTLAFVALAFSSVYMWSLEKYSLSYEDSNGKDNVLPSLLICMIAPLANTYKMVKYSHNITQGDLLQLPSLKENLNVTLITPDYGQIPITGDDVDEVFLILPSNGDISRCAYYKLKEYSYSPFKVNLKVNLDISGILYIELLRQGESWALFGKLRFKDSIFLNTQSGGSYDLKKYLLMDMSYL